MHFSKTTTGKEGKTVKKKKKKDLLFAGSVILNVFTWPEKTAFTQLLYKNYSAPCKCILTITKNAVIRDQIGFGSFTKHFFIEISGVVGKIKCDTNECVCVLSFFWTYLIRILVER